MKKTLPRVYADLFLTFFKIGLFTFGGGYAMIPVIQRETVEKHHWITEDDILDITAIAESTPGPIAVNSSTFVGYQVAGFWGAAVATFGLVLPSFLIILLLSFLIGSIEDLPFIKYAFVGIRACVLALIVKALVSMAKKMPHNVLSFCLAGAAFLVATLTDVNVIFIIIACALIGLAVSLLSKKGGERK